MLEFFEPPHKIDRFIFVLQLLLNLLDVLPEHLRVILEQGIVWASDLGADAGNCHGEVERNLLWIVGVRIGQAELA